MQNTVILVTSNGMGRADGALEQKLLSKYLEVLLLQGDLPVALCFYTDGVKLVCDGSPVIESLRALESSGVHLIICSTCLSYFDLTDRVQVGLIGGMGDIVEAQTRAEKVITI